MSCLRYSSLVWDFPSSLHATLLAPHAASRGSLRTGYRSNGWVWFMPRFIASAFHSLWNSQTSNGQQIWNWSCIFADSLPVKYSSNCCPWHHTCLGARHTLQHWMYFSHHQHAQEAPCSVLVLAPKRSAVQRGVVQEFVGARTSSPAGGVYMLVSDETSSAIQCNCSLA